VRELHNAAKRATTTAELGECREAVDAWILGVAEDLRREFVPSRLMDLWLTGPPADSLALEVKARKRALREIRRFLAESRR